MSDGRPLTSLSRPVQARCPFRNHAGRRARTWEIANRIAAGRKEREIDPALTALRACVAQAQSDPSMHPVATQRLTDMLEFTETINGWYLQMLTVPRERLAALIHLGTKIIKFLPAGRRT